MGNSQVKNQYISVVGLTNSGKTHFLDMFIFGSDSTKTPTRGFYEAEIDDHLYLIECTNLQLYDSKYDYCGIILMVNASATFEQLQESKNILLSVMKSNTPKVGIIYNNRKNDKVLFSFTERNQILQTEYYHCSIIELNFDFREEWTEKTGKLIHWIIEKQ